MIGEVFEDGEGGDGENLFLPHQPHGLVAQLIGVIDGNDTRLRGIERSRLSRGVNGDVLAESRGFFDGGFQLRLRVLIRSGEFPVFHRVCAGLVNLDEVRAFFELLAHHSDEFVGVVGVVRVGETCCAGL